MEATPPKTSSTGLRLCEYKRESADLFLILILIVRRPSLSLDPFAWDLFESRGASEPQRDFLWFYEVADLGSAMGKRCPIIDRGADLQSFALHTLQIKQNQKVDGLFPLGMARSHHGLTIASLETPNKKEVDR